MDRDKRYNAGNRMSKLMNAEEECQDEFYKENYGGFEDSESDGDYQAEEEGDDIVDSDFSIDEDDEPISDIEDAENPRKKRRVVTKAYKEPVANTPDKPKPKPKLTTPKEKIDPNDDVSIDSSERKSKRKSTAAKTAETVHRMKVRDQELKRRPKKPKEEDRMPTQEELLEEAKITEQENIKSLERYQKMEDEKKIKKITKKPFTGPVIRYTSTRVPLIEEIKPKNKPQTPKVCERTVISVQNDPHNVTFNKLFKAQPPRKTPKMLYCAVTGLKARYVDPMTSLPFRNSTCFKIIRFAYYKQLIGKGNATRPLVLDFGRWFTKDKHKFKKDVVMQAQKLKMCV